MIMTLNDVLTKQNLIVQLILADDTKELSKELKVKIMRVRMAYNKIKKQFDSDIEEFTKEIITDELRELEGKKENRTEEENARYAELNTKANSEYMEFVIQKGKEEVKNEIEDSFTEDEYFDILEVNAKNNVKINGADVKAADFMETFYEFFVK